MLSACGATQKSALDNTESSTTISSKSEEDIAGTYTYQESVMDGQFTVDWTLELREDGTYILTESGPMGETPHEGIYTYDGEIVTTGPFDGEVEATFFAEDNSCEWIIDGENCTPVSAGDETENKSESPTASNATYVNVFYASNSDSQICDIYLPEGDGPFPVIIVFHGGGFMFGDQNMEIIQPIITSAVENGYAVVSADYRKSAEAVYPAAVSDAKSVVRFVRANAEEYGLDSEHIAVWGESAGAYLAAMTALTPGVESLDGDVTDNSDQNEGVIALVDFYGPIEFYTMDEEYGAMGETENANHSAGSFECQFLGVDDLSVDKDNTYQSYWETYKDAVPSTLSVWIQAGTEDVQVPNTQSINLADRLSAIIGEENVQFSLIEGAGHEDDLFYTDENLAKVYEFLDTVMK